MGADPARVVGAAVVEVGPVVVTTGAVVVVAGAVVVGAVAGVVDRGLVVAAVACVAGSVVGAAVAAVVIAGARVATGAGAVVAAAALVWGGLGAGIADFGTSVLRSTLGGTRSLSIECSTPPVVRMSPPVTLASLILTEPLVAWMATGDPSTVFRAEVTN